MNVFILCEKHLDAFRQAIFKELVNEPQIKIVGAGINYRKQKSTLQKLKREYQKGRGGYIIIMFINAFLRKIRKTNTIPAKSFFGDLKIPTHEIRKLYAPETSHLILTSAAECIFLNGFGIIKEPILSLTPKGVISYHHGDMRYYRGQPPAFWELYNGEKEMGVTIQQLTAELDAGAIISFKKFPIHKRDTLKEVKRRIYQGSIPMAKAAILSLQQANFKPDVLSNNQLGKVYTLPNLRSWVLLQLKILFRKLGLTL